MVLTQAGPDWCRACPQALEIRVPFDGGGEACYTDYPSYQRDGARARTLATGVRHSIAPHPALQDLPRIG
ncbi:MULTISPECIES: hypothetical protein [unclassified Streptomyces]|uniref:hypothetical protein n=1 Tax=unclassified Streptomyces TaxID=2593676 RepID=UPI0030E02F79